MCNKLLAIDEDISIVYRSKREISRRNRKKSRSRAKMEISRGKEFIIKLPTNESIVCRISRVNCISPAIYASVARCTSVAFTKQRKFDVGCTYHR